MNLRKGLYKIFYFSRHPHDGNFFLELKQLLGFVPKHMDLYLNTFALQNPNLKSSKQQRKEFQRLEYLGDSILGAVVSSYLYRLYPDEDEGFLTQMRSKIVSRKMLHVLAVQMGLKSLMQLEKRRGSVSKSHLGDTLEALIGAVFLDKGYPKCQSFIEIKILKPHIKPDQLVKQIQSYKGSLYEWCQKNKKTLNFEVQKSGGSDHNPIFEVGVYIDSDLKASSTGRSIRLAEEEASKEAYSRITHESHEYKN
jgi:ribonuclease-3